MSREQYCLLADPRQVWENGSGLTPALLVWSSCSNLECLAVLNNFLWHSSLQNIYIQHLPLWSLETKSQLPFSNAQCPSHWCYLKVMVPISKAVDYKPALNRRNYPETQRKQEGKKRNIYYVSCFTFIEIIIGGICEKLHLSISTFLFFPRVSF